MNDARPQHTRPRFYDLCVLHAIDLAGLDQIAERAGVDVSVVHAMFTGEPVQRAEAICILEVFSLHVRESYVLGSLTIPVSD